MGVTQQSLLAHARSFDTDWPRLGKLIRGHNIVVHYAPRQLNARCTRVLAARLPDISRHRPLIERLTSTTNWDALQSGQPAPLVMLIADIQHRPAANSVEATTGEVLALYEDEASFEQAPVNQGGDSSKTRRASFARSRCRRCEPLASNTPKGVSRARYQEGIQDGTLLSFGRFFVRVRRGPPALEPFERMRV